MNTIRWIHPYPQWSESLDLSSATWMPLSCTYLSPGSLCQDRFALKSVKSWIWWLLSLSTHESWSCRALKGIKLFPQAVNGFLEDHEWAWSCVDLLVPFWPAWHTCAHWNAPRVLHRGGGAWLRQGSGWTDRPRGATRTGYSWAQFFNYVSPPGRCLLCCLQNNTETGWWEFLPPLCACPRDPYCKEADMHPSSGRGFKSDCCDFKREEKPLRKENKNPTACCSSCSFRSCGKWRQMIQFGLCPEYISKCFCVCAR